MHHINDPSWRRSEAVVCNSTLYVSLAVVVRMLSWQFLAAWCATFAAATRVGHGRRGRRAWPFRPVLSLADLRARAGRGWLHPERRGGRGQGNHRHLPLYAGPSWAPHKVMHLLGATKKRDKMKRPKPVAPVFDLERLLRTCLKDDRIGVVDNLDLVEYWPPSDKASRRSAAASITTGTSARIGRTSEHACWRI